MNLVEWISRFRYNGKIGPTIAYNLLAKLWFALCERQAQREFKIESFGSDGDRTCKTKIKMVWRHLFVSVSQREIQMTRNGGDTRGGTGFALDVVRGRKFSVWQIIHSQASGIVNGIRLREWCVFISANKQTRPGRCERARRAKRHHIE